MSQKYYSKLLVEQRSDPDFLSDHEDEDEDDI